MQTIYKGRHRIAFKFEPFVALTAITAVVYTFYQGILNYRDTQSTTEGISGIAYVMVFIVGCALLILLYNSLKRKDDHPMIWTAMTLSLLSMLSTTLSGLYAYSRLPFRFIDISYWAFVMLLLYYAVRCGKKIGTYVNIIGIAFPVLVINFFTLKLTETQSDTLLLNPVYYILFLLPVMLLLKSDIFKMLAILSTFAVLILSYKRG